MSTKRNQSSLWLHAIMEQHIIHITADGHDGHTAQCEWRNCTHIGCLELRLLMNNNSVTSVRCRCDLCNADLTGKIRYDGATRTGPWAVMCHACFEVHGLGLGIGRGQKFDADGRCIEGNKDVPSRRQ